MIYRAIRAGKHGGGPSGGPRRTQKNHVFDLDVLALQNVVAATVTAFVRLAMIRIMSGDLRQIPHHESKLPGWALR
jgi:hypothetical protein